MEQPIWFIGNGGLEECTKSFLEHVLRDDFKLEWHDCVYDILATVLSVVWERRGSEQDRFFTFVS